MLFNSLQFLIFFIIVFLVYYRLPERYRWILLLAASCYFYMAFVPVYILILFSLICIDYMLGIRIFQNEDAKKRKLFLILSICANLGMLFVFKYFNFFNTNVSELAQLIHWNYPLVLLSIALPLGLSFHVFQSLSYVIEIYKGKQVPERNIGIYALYVMFFPQLVAGPIERPQHMLPQFHTPHPFNPLHVRRGLELMLIGFFKKVVIADQLAPFVNHFYATSATQNGATMALAAIAFGYQLYCDFSGYSDIAVGAALVFGYDLTQNFRRPYASRSIPEFWRRWHISLSSWLRDYLYYPLAFAGKQVTKARLYISLFVTFVLIGLWHGANWTYVAMGALHGMYLVVSSVGAEFRARFVKLSGLGRVPRFHHALQVLCTFALATVGSVFFRANNLTQAFSILAKIAHAPLDLMDLLRHWNQIITPVGIGIGLKGVVLAILILEAIQYLQEKRGSAYIFDTNNRYIRWGWYYALTFTVLFFGYFGEQTFIYFQF